MNLIKQPWKKTALGRLVLSFICILLPIYILSILIYNWGVSTLQEEISKSMISQVSLYFTGLEKEVGRIQTLQYDALTDDNLNRLAAIPESMSEIEKVEGILRLQQRLHAIKNSSGYIKDVFAYIPAIHKNVTALTIHNFDQTEFDDLRNIPLPLESQITNINGRMILSAAYPFKTSSNKKEPLFIIAIELSTDKLQETLQSMKNTKDEGLIFVSPEFVISTREDASFDEEMTKHTYQTQEGSIAKSVDINNEHYLVVTTASRFFGAVLSKYVPESSVFKPLKKYQNWFVLLTVVALIIIVIYSLYVYTYIHKPLDRLVKGFKKIENGDFGVLIGHRHDDEFRYIYTRFNIMVENLKSLIDQVYKQQILTQKAELKQLQSQINPHFLYNSFFILNTMTRIGDYDQLEQFTNQLGEYYQFITRNNSDEVPLGKEVAHARVYTEIQEMRFSNRIRIEFDELPENMGHIMVPRLILQPIIENAFEHSLEKMPAKGLLRVYFNKDADKLQILIEDNGLELSNEKIESLNKTLSSPDETLETTGTLNIHQRIRLKFGSKSGLHMERSDHNGLKATITIYSKDGGV
jgi:two-component system sensor histidine kinase YesM